MKIKQTAGREALGDFAPDFAHYNDDVLFGENWNNEDIDVKTRCLLTVSALISSGLVDSSLTYHLENAKRNGVSKKEIAAAITHLAFYVGWPKAWAAFRLAKDVWAEEALTLDDKELYARSLFFPLGEENAAFAMHFTGKSYLAPVATKGLRIFNVTFEPGARNDWHIHRASKGGGQILLAIAGRGYYQEEGGAARLLLPGDVVEIPANVKHWHGAAPKSWFSHLAVEVPGENASTEWLEKVGDDEYPPSISD